MNVFPNPKDAPVSEDHPFSRLAGYPAAVIGALVLAGWAWDMAALKSFLPGTVSMKPNTALAFVLAGAALGLLAGTPVPPRRARLGQWLGLLVALIAGLTLSQYLFGWSLGIDELLFQDDSNAVGTVIPGRMAPSTAVCFALLGLALLGIEWEPRRGIRLAEVLVVGVGAVSLLSLIEYAFEQPVLYSFTRYTRMALHTAIVFLLLSVGVLLARPTRGVVGVIRAGMTGPQERRVYLILLVGFLLLAAVGVVSFFNARQVFDRSHSVEHAQQVRRELATLLCTLQDVETGMRGYVVTGNPQFLEPYDAARREVEREVRELAALIRDPAQDARLRELEPVIQQRVEAARRVVEARQTQGFAPAAQLVETGRGNELMDAIRAKVRQMDDEEVRLLDARRRDNHTSFVRMILTILISAVLALAVALYAVVVVHRDFAQRQRAEAALRESEENLAVTVRSIGDGVLATDATGRVTRLNAVAEKLTGWSEAEAQGRPVAEVFHIINETTRQPAVVPVDQVLQSGEIHGLANHTILIARDGQERPIADSAAPIRAAAGQLRGVVLVFRDVTEEKRAEREIRRLNDELEQRVRERTAELESQRRHNELLLNSAGEGLYGLDLDGRVTFMNPAGAHILGYTVEELLGQPIHAKCHHTHADGRPFPREHCPIYAAFQDGHVHRESDDVMWRKDGSAVAVEYTSTPMRDEEGQLSGAIVVFSDITERKRSEEAIWKSEMEKSLILNNANEIIAFHDRDQRLIWANRAYLDGISKTTGLPGRIEDVKGKKCFEAWGLSKGCGNCPVTKAIQTGQPHEAELTPQNQEHWLAAHGSWMVRAAPVRDSSGAVVGAIEVAHDITERKRAEAELHREQEFLHALLQSAAEGVVACDAKGTLVLFNRTARDWHGVDVRALPPEEWARHYDLFEADGRTPLRTEAIPLVRAFRGESIRDVEFAIVPKGQPARFVLASGGPFFDAQGGKLGAVIAMYDTTLRKQAELEIHKLNAELELRVQERTRQLAEANQELSTFNKTMVGREQRIIEIKEEVNALCRELGREPEYPPVWRKET